MRPIFKQIAELIGKAIADLRKSIEPRIKALEDLDMKGQVEQLRQHLSKDAEAIQVKTQEVLEIKLDAQGFLEAVKQAGDTITQQIEELRVRTLNEIAAAVTSHGNAVRDQLAHQNQLTGELRALLEERKGQPELEEIVSKCLTVIRGTEPEIVLPDVSGFLNEAQVLALIGNATKDLQPIMDLTVVAREVATQLPSLDDIALQAATLVDIPKAPDLSQFVTAEQVTSSITKAIDENEGYARLRINEQIRLGFEAMPSVDSVAKAAAAMIEIPVAPDLTGLVKEDQVQSMINIQVKDKVDSIAVAKAIAEQLPALEEVARKAARMVEIPAAPDLSGYALAHEVQFAIGEVRSEVSVIRGNMDGIPSAESIIDKVVAAVQIPDTSAFLNAEQVQEMIATDRYKFAVPPVTPIEVARAAIELLPAPLSPEVIARAAADLIPTPKDGESVELDQVMELVNKAVAAIKMPTPEEVASSLGATHLANWALDFERRAQDLLQRCVSQFPRPKDGVDGLGFEDMTIEFDGKRTFKFVFVRGERRKEYPFKVQAMVYRGIYDDQLQYDLGDVTTFGGSSWIALKDFPQGKPGQSHDWQLVVKKGRDGSSK